MRGVLRRRAPACPSCRMATAPYTLAAPRGSHKGALSGQAQRPLGKLEAGGESYLRPGLHTSTAMLKSTMETLVLRCQQTCTIVLPR